MYGNVTIQNSLFQDNKATTGTKGLFIGFSDVVIKGTTFEETTR